MHAISSYRSNRPPNTSHKHPPTNRQDRLQYTTLQLGSDESLTVEKGEGTVVLPLLSSSWVDCDDDLEISCERSFVCLAGLALSRSCSCPPSRDGVPDDDAGAAVAAAGRCGDADRRSSLTPACRLSAVPPALPWAEAVVVTLYGLLALLLPGLCCCGCGWTQIWLDFRFRLTEPFFRRSYHGLMAVDVKGCGQFHFSGRPHNPTSRFWSSQMSVVTAESFSDRPGPR